METIRQDRTGLTESFPLSAARRGVFRTGFTGSAGSDLRRLSATKPRCSVVSRLHAADLRPVNALAARVLHLREPKLRWRVLNPSQGARACRARRTEVRRSDRETTCNVELGLAARAKAAGGCGRRPGSRRASLAGRGVHEVRRSPREAKRNAEPGLPPQPP